MTWHSNIWTAGTWHDNIWIEYGTEPSVTTERLGLLEAILGNMEKHSIGEYLGVPGLFEPGMDNFVNPLRTILKKMEKKST